MSSDPLELEEHGAEADEPEMFFYGVGNHGGGPTVKELRQIEAWTKENPDLRFGQPGDFFEYVGDGQGLHKIVEGDLQHHAIGCYSARSEIKKNNRRAENRLLARLTNNGTQPTGPIREQGGLKTLRTLTEQAGGVMTVTVLPGFAVCLELPKEVDHALSGSDCG